MRYLKVAAVVSFALLLSGCGTMPYSPSEYPLRDGLISVIPAKGEAKIINDQTSTAPVIVYSYGGTKLSSDLRSITNVMVDQTSKELAKAAQPSSGEQKTIELKVTYLQSRYIAFFWKSNLKFEAKLGNGEVISKTVPHTSGVLLQDLKRVCRILCKRGFGLQLRQTALELDGKAVQRGLPIPDWHRPFLADVA